MRITYIHQYFKTPNEAGGTRSYEFASRLARDGHDVTMICGGSVTRTFDVNGFRVKQLAANYTNGMSMRRRILSMSLFMIRAIATSIRQPADLVFATSTPISVAVPGILAAKLNRARFVFEVRDLWPAVPYQLGILKDGPLYRLAFALEWFTYRTADHVIALSPGMEAGVRKVSSSVPITVIPNASDHEVFSMSPNQVREIRKELSWSDEDRVAVYAGSFGPTYDVLRWLQIAASTKSWRFVVIGEGAQTEQARILASQLGLNVDRVLPGSMPKHRVARYLAASDICLSSLAGHSALSVNSLNKVFDALAAGRPVAFTHDGWLPDLLTEAGAGWRLSDDPAEAALQLDQLTIRQIEEGAEAAKRLGRRSFSRDTLYERLRDTFVMLQ